MESFLSTEIYDHPRLHASLIYPGNVFGNISSVAQRYLTPMPIKVRVRVHPEGYP